ncbi:hypothetical protein [Halodesulfovibrio aestuarii]|uniref:Uncharacterized protein n=1 Tax=Halodesulfovibrio aestuarii TaxID=126333 RepID=A0ABV4JNN8_9BACT|nr:hypothetical protein [Halodesulfovibrio aestuarii]
MSDCVETDSKTNMCPHVCNRIKQGLVIAVESMINAGVKATETLKDHWTIFTKDRKPSAHFEHCIAVAADAAEVLTCGSNGEGWAM